MLKALRANWIAFASSVLLLGTIVFILGRQQNIDMVVDTWRRMDIVTFAFSVLLMMVLQTTVAWRLKTILSADGLASAQFRSLLRIQFISQFVANGAPISALADVAKATMLKLRFSLTTGRSIRLILYERICGMLGTVVVGLFFTLFQLALPAPQGLVASQLLLWAGGLLAVAALLVIGGLHVVTGIGPVDRIAHVFVGLGRMLRRPVIAGELTMASFAQIAGFAVIFIILAAGMHLSVSSLQITLYMPLIFFVSALPIFYLGWGAREAAVIATLGTGGSMTSGEAVALSVTFGIVVFLASLPGAIFWLMRPSMRAATRAEAKQR
jgi:uncharacterized membrane protein YbhN (UPF0104 family)